MLNPTLIRDLRKSLNEAQDYGQEALVNVKRAHRKDVDAIYFEKEAAAYTRAAVRRALAWKRHIATLCDGTMEI